MANSDQTVSVDIQKLSTSLTEKCKNLYPLSKDRCISRVPRQVRGCKSKDHYTPEVVSIGPLHHGKEELKDMEEHKMRYLHYFLNKRTQVRIEDFLTLIEQKEMKFRTFYSDVIDKKKYDLSMILLDVVFLIEYFWRGYEHAESRITNDEDLLFGEPRIEVIWDLLLVENQIPLFILSDLFDRAKTATSCDHHQGLSLIKMTSWFRNKIADYFPVQPNLLEINFSEARHILDMLSLCFRPTTPKNIEDKEQNMPSLCCRSTTPKNTEAKEQNIPSIKQLHQAGMKIRKAPSDKNLLDITFKDGILEIPFLNIYDNTERIYRNIIAFEHMHASTCYFNDYVLLMSFLVTTVKDAELLIQNKVIGRRYRQTLSTVFSSLNKTCNWSDDEFQYSGLVEKLNVYCGSHCRKWKASWIEKYFNTPWSFLSVVAAVILLLLTIVQTICSIIAL